MQVVIPAVTPLTFPLVTGSRNLPRPLPGLGCVRVGRGTAHSPLCNSDDPETSHCGAVGASYCRHAEALLLLSNHV